MPTELRALLDVNVLVALLDAAHLHHARARAWLVAHTDGGWASCPITQNGCVRVMSQPGYPNPQPIAAVIQRLADATNHKRHEFWPDDVSLLDPPVADPRRIHGPKQITDLYLLALAVKRRARLATFDDAIPVSAIPGATPRSLVVI